MTGFMVILEIDPPHLVTLGASNTGFETSNLHLPAELELRVGVALRRGHAVVLFRRIHVLRNALPVTVVNSKVELPLGIALDQGRAATAQNVLQPSLRYDYPLIPPNLASRPIRDEDR